MRNSIANILASTFVTLLGTFTASSIVYTFCYAINLYC